MNLPHFDVPHTKGAHRILNVHHNRPGELSKLNSILGQLDANVHVQMLAMNQEIGGLELDIDRQAGDATKDAINAEEHNISIMTMILEQTGVIYVAGIH